MPEQPGELERGQLQRKCHWLLTQKVLMMLLEAVGLMLQAMMLLSL